jgi:hypothetical protein
VIQSKLNGVDGRSSSQVVHSRLETLLPSVEVHRGQLTHRRVGQVDVERLGLVDEGTSVGGEVDDGLLADLPDGLVDRLQLGRDAGNVLNGTAMGDAAERGRTKERISNPDSRGTNYTAAPQLTSCSSCHRPTTPC